MVFRAVCFILYTILSSTFAEDNINLVVVGLEPGLSNPTRILPADKQNTDWAWEGPKQLNSVGKSQSYAFGQYLRDRYGSLLSKDYFDDEFVGITCSESKCQTSLLSLYAGLYPSPRARLNMQLSWQPIPLQLNDEALGISNLNCRYYQDLKSDYLNKTEKVRQNANLSDIAIYLDKNSGVKSTAQGMIDVIENWRAMKTSNVAPPTYLANPTLQSYTSNSLYDKLEVVESVGKQLCSSDETCRKTAASYWLSKLLEVIEDKSTQNSTRKMIVNVAETDNLLSLLKLMNIEKYSSSSTSGFFMEVKLYPTPALRFITHSLSNLTDNNRKLYDRKLVIQNLPYCSNSEWCPVDVFVEHLRKDATSSHLCNGSSATKAILFTVVNFVVIVFAMRGV